MGQVLMYPKAAQVAPPVTTKRKDRKEQRREKGAGHIFRAGRFWYLRYRDWEVNGDKLERKQKCRKLAEVEPAYRSKEPPAEVRELAHEFLCSIKASESKPQCTQLLSEYVECEFFPYIEQQVRASTYRGYRICWKQLQPYCDGLRLRDTETADLQRLFERMARQTNLGKLSLAHLKAFLSGVFSKAIRDGVMPKGFANPVREVKLPNARGQERETHAYSLEEVREFLTVLPEPSRTAFAVAAFAGLRRSEIRGLRWEDYGEVVFDDGTKGMALHISRSNWNGIESKPKTKKSGGFVPVIPLLAKLLDQHRLRSGNPASGPIFKNEAGKAACLNNFLNRQILPAIRRCRHCGVSESSHQQNGHAFELGEQRPRWYGWHAGRRGLATNLHRLGVPDKVIQQILRHADVGVTQRAYIKTVDADAAQAMKLMEANLPKGLAELCATFVQRNPENPTNPNPQVV